MKLNGHINKIEKEQNAKLEARKRVYKILCVSDEFVPNLEALITNNVRIRDLFNELLDYQLNQKNDLKIARLKFWGPVLGWATLTLSSFIGPGLLYNANVLSADLWENVVGLGLVVDMLSAIPIAASGQRLEEEINRAKSESEKMDDIVNEINGMLAGAIMNNAPSIQPSVNTSII